MANVQKIDYSGEHRVETGAVQFGDDWPGLFIRGDDAAYMRFILEGIANDLENKPIASDFLAQFIEIIENDVRVK